MASARTLALLTLAVLLVVPTVPTVTASLSAQPDRSTFVGGSEHDEGQAIDVGPDGRIYVVGQTNSRDFPGDANLDLSTNAFVAVLSADATRLEWSWVFGGTSFDAAYAVKVSGDRVFVAGQTESSNFPVTGPDNTDRTYGGNADGFLTMFTTAGAMGWSSYVGGSAYDIVMDVDVDADGKVVVGGTTRSCDFPTMDTAFRKPPAGCTSFSGDAFLSRYWPDGPLHRTTLFGGSGSDRLHGLTVSPTTGSILFTGLTDSSDLPVSTNAAQTRADDSYVSKMDSTMSTLAYMTYLGGSSLDWAWDIAQDPQGNAYVTGYTYSTDFPTTSGAYRRQHASPTGCADGAGTLNAPCQDVFVTKIHLNGTAILWSSFLGGKADDEALGVAVGPDGNVYVAGTSESRDTFLPAHAAERGFADGFVAGLSPNGASLLLLSGLSGSDWDAALGLDVGSGRVWATGFTWSEDYPTTAGAFDRTHGGTSDAFASGLLLPVPPPPPPPPALVFDHKGGNEWWIEVTVTGGTVTAVEARDTGGAWVPLAKKSWGPWAASFHIEPGNLVQFRAMRDGAWTESCWFTHPAGVEQCGVPPPPPAFSATFSDVKGNEWWIETRVSGTKPIARVDVSLNGGAPKPLELKSWGSWARSYHAPSGTIVRFTAWSAAGEAVQSSCYRWTTATVVSCTTPPPPAGPVFDHKGGNEWWVEVVVSGPTPDRVEARDTDGGWVALTPRSWGAWANSFHIEPGHDVQFRALVGGSWFESCWFSHPGGQARTGGTTCPGTRVA